MPSTLEMVLAWPGLALVVWGGWKATGTSWGPRSRRDVAVMALVAVALLPGAFLTLSGIPHYSPLTGLVRPDVMRRVALVSHMLIVATVGTMLRGDPLPRLMRWASLALAGASAWTWRRLWEPRLGLPPGVEAAWLFTTVLLPVLLFWVVAPVAHGRDRDRWRWALVILGVAGASLLLYDLAWVTAWQSARAT